MEDRERDNIEAANDTTSDKVFKNETENEYKEKVKPQHQDSVFSRLYSKKARVIDLYRTLHSEDTREISEEDVEIITLENIVLARRYNDVAFQIGDRLMILVEHQSTLNENMPLRMLLYVADEYEKLIHKSEIDLYKRKLVKLPKPEFYIIYTGETKWEADELKFSDAYGREDDATLELKVKVLKEEDAPDTESTLGAFRDFTKYLKGKIKDGEIEAGAIEAYAREFEGSELFKEFLEEICNEEGVKMVYVEYDYELEKSVIREEGREEGIKLGDRRRAVFTATKMIEAGKFSTEEIVLYTGLTLEQVNKLKEKQPI